jgi:UV DNA damage endonuclease
MIPIEIMKQRSMTSPIERVGFACVTHELGLSTNHTFRLKNLNGPRLEQAIDKNLSDFEAILAWMLDSGLRLFRIGSSLIPFASHAAMNLDWKSLCAERLQTIGQKYAPLGFRFSMHPGQYNVLNSHKQQVIQQALAELNYSCEVLDLMGLDASHKVILHGGGVYGDKAGSTARLEGALKSLPGSVRRRLALENDERYYSFEEIVTVSLRTGIPAVFDYHHHTINPCRDVEKRLHEGAKVWDSLPKVHLSSQKPGAKPGSHDLLVHREDLYELLALLPFKADLMVEAKAKELAASLVLKWLSEYERAL